MKRNSAPRKWANFLYGMGSVLEIWPPARCHSFRQTLVGRTAWNALYADAVKVSGDWRAALERLRSELSHGR